MSTMRNSVKLIGRPGADPQTRTFENNRSVTHFSLAVNESYQNAKKESKGRHDITEIQIEDFYPLDWEDSAAKS